MRVQLGVVKHVHSMPYTIIAIAKYCECNQFYNIQIDIIIYAYELSSNLRFLSEYLYVNNVTARQCIIICNNSIVFGIAYSQCLDDKSL